MDLDGTGNDINAFLLAGGFDGTSNVLAGKLYNIPVKGTHAHAYVTSFSGADDLKDAKIKHKYDDYVEDGFFDKCLEWRTKLASHLKIMRDEAHDGELAAFASYAVAFPDGFLALVDTYDVSRYNRLPFCTIILTRLDRTKSNKTSVLHSSFHKNITNRIALL